MNVKFVPRISKRVTLIRLFYAIFSLKGGVTVGLEGSLAPIVLSLALAIKKKSRSNNSSFSRLKSRI